MQKSLRNDKRELLEQLFLEILNVLLYFFWIFEAIYIDGNYAIPAKQVFGCKILIYPWKLHNIKGVWY